MSSQSPPLGSDSSPQRPPVLTPLETPMQNSNPVTTMSDATPDQTSNVTTTSTTHPTSTSTQAPNQALSLDEQLDILQPSEDPLLTRLKTPAVEFPAFSNADFNDWVSFQASSAVDPRFISPSERTSLRHESDLVNDKIKEISAPDCDKNTNLDLVQLFSKVVNTHPSISHLTYPIPSFLKALMKNALVKKSQSIGAGNGLSTEIQNIENALQNVRQRFDVLNDAHEDQLQSYYHKLETQNVDMRLYEKTDKVISTQKPVEVVLSGSQASCRNIVVNEKTALGFKTRGVYLTSKLQFLPVSLEDLQIEINILNALSASKRDELAESRNKRTRLQNGDLSDFPDWNPWLDITHQDIVAQLSSLQSLSDLVAVPVIHHQAPITDISGDIIKSSTEIPMDIKTAALNGGFGFFFQLSKNADPTINQGGPTFILGDVVFEPVPALPAQSPVDKSKGVVQPRTNMQKAIEHHHLVQSGAPQTADNPIFNDWFPSPLLEQRFQTTEAKQSNQSGIMKMISRYTAPNQPQEHHTVYNFNNSATFTVKVDQSVTTVSDCGSAGQQVAHYLLQLIKYLTPSSTHFTTRVYFHGVRSHLEALLKAFNKRALQAPSVGTKAPLFSNEVPLTGLINQGVTCYLNTYLQALYGLPYLRKALFHVPVTKQESDSSLDDETFVPLCTHKSQQIDGVDLPGLNYVPPSTIDDGAGDCHHWVEAQNKSIDQRYCTSLREFFLRNGKVGKHVSIKGIQEFAEGQEPENKRKIKEFPYLKIISHLTTPNTAALQSLFLEMQTSANNYFKHIYTKQYAGLFHTMPEPKQSSPALYTRTVTQSFLSKQFGWRRSQLGEQQDLQELARKVTDNLEQSTFNTIVEGVTQRLFKGYYENVTQAINVPFTKIAEEAYEDLILPVRDCSTLADSFTAYQVGDEITGYKTDHPEYGVQTVLRSQRLTDKLPPILTLMLKRMDFDYTTFEQTKINSRLEFPPVLDMSFVHRSAHKDEVPADAGVSGTAGASGSRGDNNTNVAALDALVDELGIDLEQYPGALNQYNTQMSAQDAAAHNCPRHGDQSLIYDLYSVLVHAGNINSGHYINFIRPLRGTEFMTKTTNNNNNNNNNNNSYTLPSNRFQATGSQFNSTEPEGLDQSQSQMQTQTQTQNQDLDSHSLNSSTSNNNNDSSNNNSSNEPCTCTFDHNKADFYRQGDWYCFDDDQVKLSSPKEAIDDNYGVNDTNRFNAGKSAYLLMYINRRYTYFDKTNAANELVFHPATFSTLGQKLLPASALPDSAIPRALVDAVVPDVNDKGDDVVLDLLQQNQNDDVSAQSQAQAQAKEETVADKEGLDGGNGKNNKHGASEGNGNVAGTESIYDVIFMNIEQEQEKIQEQLQNAETKESYEKLQRLQQARLNNSGFISIYPPLPLRRVLAQSKNTLSGKSPHANARFKAAEAAAYQHTTPVFEPSDFQHNNPKQYYNQVPTHAPNPSRAFNTNPYEDNGQYHPMGIEPANVDADYYTHTEGADLSAAAGIGNLDGDDHGHGHDDDQ